MPSARLSAPSRAPSRRPSAGRAVHAADAARLDDRAPAAAPGHPSGRTGHDRRQCRHRGRGGEHLSEERALPHSSATRYRLAGLWGSFGVWISRPRWPGRFIPAVASKANITSARRSGTRPSRSTSRRSLSRSAKHRTRSSRSKTSRRNVLTAGRGHRAPAVFGSGVVALRKRSRQLFRGA